MNKKTTNILVVDDNADMRQGTALVLERAGFSTLLAANGEEALRLLAERHPALVLLDWDMPGIDGLEVCRRVKADRAFDDVMVVLISATRNASDDQVSSLELGADGFIARPISNAELVARVEAFARIASLGAELRAKNTQVEATLARLKRRELTELSLLEDAVAERRKVETSMNTLAASEARFRQMFENNTAVLLLIDANTDTIVDANATASKYYGYPLEQLQGMSIDRIRALDPAEFAARRDQAVAKQRSFFEFSHRLASGEIRDVEVHFTPITSEGKTLLFSIVHDVSERKAGEAKLRASEEQYRLLISTMVEGVVLLDANSTIVTHNAAAERILGLSSDQMTGRTTFDPRWRAICADGSPFPADTMPAPVALKTGVPQRGVIMGIHKQDDAITWITVNAEPVFQPGHTTPTGVVTTMHDITDRKLAEESLAESERQFRGMVEQSIAGFYVLQDGKIAYVNPRYAELLAFEAPEELVGRDPLALIPETDRDRVANVYREALEGQTPKIAYTAPVMRRDGTVIEVGAQGIATTFHGRPAIIGLMQDISERKRADEQIRRYLEQIQSAFMRTVEVAMTLSEMRDPYTAGHERRVAEVAVAIGREMGLDANTLEGLRVAGYLHDIGKISLPAELLSKPSKLTAIEYGLIKTHAQASYDVLKGVDFPWPVAQVALQHHERIDGSGYPNGLKGDGILLEARIMAVADVIEAMSSHRPYRPGLGIDKALEEIDRGRGSSYDPVIVDAGLRLFREKGYVIPE